jgi:hypothetical protein
MGKKSRGKLQKRQPLEPSVKTNNSPAGIELWLPWTATFLLNAVGVAVGNGPWEISGALFFVSIPCTWISAYRWFSATQRTAVKAVAIAFAMVLTIATCWVADNVMRIPISIGSAAQKSFASDLASAPTKPELVLISCAANNDDSCAFAEQFIPLFQRAGWKVSGPQVNRVTLGRYTKEIVTADYGPPLVNPQNPDEGVWTKMLPWRMSEDSAFRKIGIRIHSINDPALPNTQTRLYFGLVPTRSLIEILSDWTS